MKKLIIFIMTILLLPMQGCSHKTVKWLIYSSFEQEELVKLEDRINNQLDDMNKNYKIKLYSYGYDDSYEDIIKIANDNTVDIINLLPNNDNPNSFILRMINDGYCVEINDTYNNSHLFSYNDKLYGYGNIPFISSTGYSYDKEYIESVNKDIDDLSTDIVIKDVVEYGKDHSNFATIRLVLDNLYIIDNLYYVDLLNNSCGYLYDHKDVRDIYELNREMVNAGYAINTDLFGLQDEDPGFSNCVREELFNNANKLEYSSFYGKECIFKKDFYEYTHINVNNIENVIYMNSKNKDSACDFLNELYTNRTLCNVILYGDSDPVLKDNYTYNEYNEVTYYYERQFCNESLVDNPYGWNVERKQKAIDEYNNQYSYSQLNGFVFVLDNELLDTYNKVKDTFTPNGNYSGNSSKLLNMSSYYENAWNTLKEDLNDKGGQAIINELQRQINEYIK